MKARCCPRCLTITGDPEDGVIHTYSPTEAWREMEARIAELEARIAAILGTEGRARVERLVRPQT
jgi:hypothetical protein